MIQFINARMIDPQETKAATIDSPSEKTTQRLSELWIDQGRIIAAPPVAHRSKTLQTIDLGGKILMAGAIDLHSHIAGGKVNLTRQVLTSDRSLDNHSGGRFGSNNRLRSGSGSATPSGATTAYRYTELGYSMAFEPAMVPANARSTHREMSDMPLLDQGAYVMLGNEDFLLRMLLAKSDQKKINDYVGFMIHRTRAMGVKVVNAGGINAFKFNQRSLGLDSPGPHYGVKPRQIIYHLARAVYELGLVFPLHVHCNDLGIPGNVATTLATVEAAAGYPIHLTHVQFHAYGNEGRRKFSSAAAQIAEAVNRTANLTVDVGQIMFGQTITSSGDSMAQYRNSRLADPKKFVCMDIECDGGCGLVPFRYRDQNFVNALQWAIGLELFLLVDNPWKIFLTTDHPNGAPFTAYPTLIRLLMDRDYRNDCLSMIHPAAQKVSILKSLTRVFSLEEIAILTRTGPAKILGMEDYGTLKAGAVADLVVYNDIADRKAMFTNPDRVYRNGIEVARDGTMRKDIEFQRGVTHLVRPDYDRAIETELRQFFDDYMTVGFDHFGMKDDAQYEIGSHYRHHPLKSRES